MPTKIQYFFAKKWLWRFLFLGCSLCIGFAVAMPTYIMQKGLISAILSGACAGVLLSYFAIRGLYRIIIRINGAPFHKGDTVQILVGEHKDHVVTVYEEWLERKQVRVYLDEEEKEAVTDVFSYTEIFKVKK